MKHIMLGLGLFLSFTHGIYAAEAASDVSTEQIDAHVINCSETNSLSLVVTLLKDGYKAAHDYFMKLTGRKDSSLLCLLALRNDSKAFELWCNSKGVKDYIDQPDHSTCTPLHYAAYNGNLDIVQLLIKAGADGNVVDYYGHTPLDVAFERGHFAVVGYLQRADFFKANTTHDYANFKKLLEKKRDQNVKVAKSNKIMSDDCKTVEPKQKKLR